MLAYPHVRVELRRRKNVVKVTRVSIGQLVMDSFAEGPAGREELIEAARQHGASPEAVATLERLRRARYRELRDLWAELHDVPVA